MKRYFVAVMCSFVYICDFFSRININIAIIEMVKPLNSTSINQVNIPRYDWDDTTQQQILGSFYYGFAFSALVAGWLVGKTGGKPTIVFILFWQSLLSVLIPWASGVSSIFVIIIRILQGLIEGVIMSAFYATITKWIVPQERSTLISIGLSGASISEVFCYPLSSWICTASSAGWPMSFYTYSALSVIVLIVFMIFVYDDPEEDPFISNDELEYLKRFSDTNLNKAVSVSWRDIMTSTAVWSLIIAYTVYVISFTFILTEAPVFFSSILKTDTTSIGLITSVPAILESIVIILCGICADVIIKRNYMTVIHARKLVIILMLGISSLSMACIGFFEHSPVVSVILLTLSFGCLGCYTSSIMPNVMEVSKEGAGKIVGIMTCISHAVFNIIMLILEMLLKDGNTASQWSLMFRIIAAINLFGMIFFLIFAKAEQLTKSDGNITNQEMKSYKTIKD